MSKNVSTNNSPADTRFETKHSRGVDVKGLEAELRQRITGEVRFDDGSRALYATDGSNYRQVPIGVVLPCNEDDVCATVAICHQYGAPVLSRGGGTSLAGQCCNVAVVMDMSKYYNKVLDIDRNNKLVRIQPGIVLDEMRKATDEQAGLTFGPDPATHSHCCLGGMLGNNSCGVHSVMAQFQGNGARVSDNTERLKIITYDGVKMDVGPTSDEEYARIQTEGGRKAEIYRRLRELRDRYADQIRSKFPNIPRRVSGYNLPQLLPENGFNVARALVGSEGTCVTILEATLQLLPTPKNRSLLVLGYKDVFEAGDAVMPILKHEPIGLEGIDDILIGYMEKKGMNLEDLPLLPEGKGWLLVEFGGDSKEESDNKARNLMKELKETGNAPTMSLFDDPDQEKMLWEIRESGLGATAWIPGESMGAPGWEDSAVPPEKVGAYLKELRALFHKYKYNPSLYGHFGQGCIHCRVQFDLFTEQGIKDYKDFTVEAAHLVVRYGGALSGEHGDGQARGDLLEIMFGPEILQAFHEFKSIWDPAWKMNPGKIIDTYGQLGNLRIDNHYNPPQVKTWFHYGDEENSFARATIRCVGVGNCRRHEQGTMCPSYMVTREEKHSTRGRARMLFEMLEGDVTKNGWKDEQVKESLDLCLACKGCKGDCPVNVDMATYKSEFLSHYYEGRLRPRTAYAFGWIYWWSRLASRIPGIANFMMHAPVIGSITKAIAGVEPRRTMPKFAERPFKQWFKARPRRNQGKPKVILWADTFNNFFLPETLVAGVEVLEAAGFEVITARQSLCCGRPLYDFGMLKTARRMLQQIMDSLRDEIEAGTPIVGLEPSCVAVFRDELLNLFPDSETAKRLKKNVFTLAEFLEKKAPEFKIPVLKKKAIIHGHCHHKAIMKMDCEKSLLRKTGLDVDMLDSGCCGMAGYFGYEKGEHYDVSIAAGERVLLPAVRKADKETIIIADGFSCREQIEQETDRKGLHLAQVLQMALRQQNAAEPPLTSFPEKRVVDGMKIKDPNKIGKTVATVAGLGIAVLLFSAFRNKSK
ncbi:MAG: FAD-binding and (Fe-S)-binding domain-containing protein [Bacteroidota bacterium]|nr:FAD-binding and (Fe-S)-binding domain-containing protein [Bacteroidota bacterium]MDP4254037.1 FAD-binding and (Fe-S)-binding domain-containing protein [Bacteroidota bacterium]